MASMDLRAQTKLTGIILAFSLSAQAAGICQVAPEGIADNEPEQAITIAAAMPGTTTEEPALNSRIDVSDPTNIRNRIDELTRKILLRVISQERFNMNYSLEAAKQGRWKGWRYAFFNEINSGMGLAGAIIGTAERGSHIYSPAKVHNAMQQNACFIPMIGAIIGAGAAVIELGINEYHELLAAHKGFSPKTAIAYVKATKSDIDSLMAERQALMLNAPDKESIHAKIDEAEGRVLKDLQAQGLLEFERLHVGARRLLAFQQLQYMFDFSKNVTNAIGYDFAFLSLHRHRRVWNYRAGVLFLVSGGLYIGGPIASRLFGKAVAEIEKRKLSTTVAEAHEASIAVLKEDQAALEKLCQKCAVDQIEVPVDRLAIYGSNERHFEDQLSKSMKQRDKAKLVATQNIGSGFYVGGTKVACGVLFAIPGYYQRYNSSTLRASRMTNDYLFISSVISIPSSLYSMLDTLRIQVSGELNRQKQLKAGVHPSQLAAARLAQLDEMERKIKAMDNE
ncbi:MAG: hypothetical protein K2W82_01440 [Candidatus Obscuribacterales bacterium]|nr:hypothetical protein [Candidatus Obscuribacterales bacterium]